MLFRISNESLIVVCLQDGVKGEQHLRRLHFKDSLQKIVLSGDLFEVGKMEGAVSHKLGSISCRSTRAKRVQIILYFNKKINVWHVSLQCIAIHTCVLRGFYFWSIMNFIGPKYENQMMTVLLVVVK